MVFVFRVKTALLGQFSPTGAHREDCGPLSEQCCRSPWIASLEKGIGVERAQTVQTTVVVKAGLCRGNGLSRSTQSLSPCRSRTSQVDGCLPGYFLSSRRPRQNSTAAPVAEQREHARGHCVGMGICHTWECGGTVHLGSQCSYWDLVTRRHGLWDAKMETSCLVLHVLVACTLVELRQAFRRRKPQRWACRVARVLSVGWFDHIRNLDTSLVVFLRGICSGLGPSEGGIVYGLFSKEALCIGKASVIALSTARLTEHIRCLYRPGLKDANKPRYRLLRRRLWSVRFFPLAVFPTVSQTLAAEALAISMEAPMGNARDAAEERRCAARGRGPRSGTLVDGRAAGDGERATMGKYLGLFCCQRSSFKPVPASQFSFFSCLCTAHIRRRICVLWVSRASSFCLIW